MPARSSPWPVLLTVVLALSGCKRTEEQSLAGDGGAAATMLPTDPDLTRARLENGFSYLFKPAPNNGGAVELALVLRVGSAAERQDEVGLAHFVEHVAFDQRFGELAPSEFARRLGMAIGPDANGTTTPWSTSYRLVLPNADRETLSQAVEILRGLAGDVRFEESTVERQRSIVAAELRSSEDPASAASWEHLFGGSRYAKQAPGDEQAVVRTASPVQLEAFYRRWYRPQHLALVAVGQFEPAELAQLVEQRFSSLPRGQAEPVPRFEVPLTPGVEVVLREAKDLGLEQSSFELISKLPASGSSSEDDYRLTLVDRCLTSLIHARLERLWIQPSSPLGEYPALDMSGSSEGRFAAFSMRSRSKPGQLRPTIEALLVELERVRQHGFTEAELARVQAKGGASMRRASDNLSVQGEAARLVELFLSGQGGMSPAQAGAVGQRLLATIDLPALRARAAQWLGNSRQSLLALRAPGDASLASEQDLQALVSEIRTRILEPYRDDGPRQLLATLPDPGKIVRAEQVDAPELRIWTLQNGAKVVFKRTRYGTDRVLLRAVSPGGRAHAGPLHHDSARLAEVVVMNSGVGEHDIRALLRLLEGTQVQVNPWLNDDFEGFHGAAAPAELELMLQLVYLYVTSPRADPRELELLREQPDPGRSFARAISAALYPSDPRGATPNPAALDLDEMLRFYRDRFGNVSDFTFVIVGDIAETELQPLVERYLASLPGSPRSDRRPGLKDERRSGVTRVRSSGRQGGDSAVRLEFHGPAEPSTRARFDLDAVATYLETDLFEELRQQRGSVYSVEVSPDWSANAYTLTISFECLPADVAVLQKSIWEVIARVTRARVSDAAVEALKARLRERYVKAMVSTQFWATKLEQAYAHGAPPQEILSLPDWSSRITRESLAVSARRYLPRDRYLDAVWSPGK